MPLITMIAVIFCLLGNTSTTCYQMLYTKMIQNMNTLHFRIFLWLENHATVTPMHQQLTKSVTQTSYGEKFSSRYLNIGGSMGRELWIPPVLSSLHFIRANFHLHNRGTLNCISQLKTCYSMIILVLLIFSVLVVDWFIYFMSLFMLLLRLHITVYLFRVRE